MAAHLPLEVPRPTNQDWCRDDLWREAQRDELFALYQALWHLKVPPGAFRAVGSVGSRAYSLDMSSTVLDRPIGLVHARALELLDQLDAVIDGLHELELTALTDDAVIEVLRRSVRCERRVPAVRHGLVAEVEARVIPAKKHCRTTGAFLRTLVNVSTGEGAAWARDARDLVPRRSLSTGEELPRRCQRRSRTAGSALCTPG